MRLSLQRICVFVIASAAVLALLSLSSCKSAEQKVLEENFPVTIGGVTLTEAPQNVISVSPLLTEVACDMGYGSSISAVGDYCDYPPETVAGLPKVGTVLAPDFDAIGSLGAKFLLTSSQFTENDLVCLQQMGIDVVLIPPSANIRELEQMYTTIGQFFEGKTSGTQKANDVFGRQITRLRQINDLVTSYRGAEPLYSAVYLRLLPATVATGDTMEGILLERVGLINPAASCYNWDCKDDSVLSAANCDFIIYDKTISPAAIKASNLFKNDNAVKNNGLIEIDATVFERQGLRMFQAAEDLARQCYPDLFTMEPTLSSDVLSSDSGVSATD